MEELLPKLRRAFPYLTFIPSDTHSWSPQHKIISYRIDDSESSTWAIFHEIGHALLNHKTYSSDLALLKMEVEAWQKGTELAKAYEIIIAESHIQSSLDTYRDWLHRRSSCPHCERHGLQHSESLYQCLNCMTTWQVSRERFCRPYRALLSSYK